MTNKTPDRMSGKGLSNGTRHPQDSPKSTENQAVTSALEYAAKGRQVFPCDPKTKAPLTANGFKDACTNPAQIKKWWKQHPTAMIGCPTGSGLFVLDVDLPHGPATLAALEAKHGSLPITLEQQTPSGGRHLFFTGNTKNSAGKIGPGLDIRGDGGYAIVAPSINADGNSYQWTSKTAPAAPGWLEDVIVEATTRATHTPKTGTGRPGDDFNERGNIRPLLERHGWKFFKNAGAFERWTRPEKESGSSATIYDDGSLYVFSPNALPFESDRRYSPFAVFAMLEHGRDYQTAAAALRKDGYGKEEPIQPDNSFKLRRFTFNPVSALLADRQPTEWITKRYLARGALATLFGPPETLKTFIAISMGLSISSGLDWYGNEIKHPGPVLYLCGEGQQGIKRRIKAWLIRNKTEDAAFFVSSAPASLLDPSSLAAMEAAADEITEGHGPPALIIIDTLNRNFGPGDENSTTDMTKFVAVLDRLKDRYGCAILVIHHTGLASADRGRGNSALHGAMDFQYTVKRESKAVVLSCSKCKDHERPADLAFNPLVVDLGENDEDGQPLTSLVMELTATPDRRERQLPAAQRIALDALKTVLRGKETVHLDEWRNEAYAAGISDTPNGKRQAFNRARTALLSAKRIATRDDQYSLPVTPLHTVTKRDNVTPCIGESVTYRDTTLKGVTHVTHPKANQEMIEAEI